MMMMMMMSGPSDAVEPDDKTTNEIGLLDGLREASGNRTSI